jgi:hypothetical protein
MILTGVVIIFLCFIENTAILKSEHEFKDSEPIKYLEYSFKRNLTTKDTLTPEEFFLTYFYNQIYINLKVGSNKIEIPFYFYLQQYPLVLQPANVDEDQVKGKYDEEKSSSYKPLNKSEIQTFKNGDLLKAILSKDYFYFNNKGVFINFYLSKENYGSSHITEGGKIGFKLGPKYDDESEETCFINNLKRNNIISSSIVSLEYDSSKIDEDSGKIYMGSYPHLFRPSLYKEEYFKKALAKKNVDELLWAYFFEEIRINNEKIDLSKDGFFYPEIGFIIGNNNFFDYLNKTEAWKEYFYITKKCHMLKFRINDFESNDELTRFLFQYTGYYCDKDVDVEKLNIQDITFFKKNENITINLTSKDIWMEKYGYKYLMIIRTDDTENSWYFGKPFFKKYTMAFDFDSKLLGMYTKIFEGGDGSSDDDEDDNSNIKLIIIIVALSLIIIGLIIFLIKCYLSLPRKKRANELSDDLYNYEEEKNEINN